MSSAIPQPTGGRLLSEPDLVQLTCLMTEISWRIDHGQAATVHELFVPGGEMTLGPDQTLSGREAIAQWGRGIDEAPWRIRHVTTNSRFVSEAEGTATGTTLVTAYMVQGDGPGSTVPWVIGEDHDQLVRVTEGWRLRSRRWEQLFMREDT